MVDRPPLLPYGFFAADSPDLPVRAEDDAGGPEYVVKAAVVKAAGRDILLAGTTAGNESVRIAVGFVSRGIVRIRLQRPDTESRQSVLVRDDRKEEAAVTIEKGDGSISLADGTLKVRIALDPFGMAFLDAKDRLFLEQNSSERDATDRMTVLPFGYSRVGGKLAAFHDTFTAEPDEHFYGFGEKFTELDKRGQRLEMWHYDAYGTHCERAHKNVPFFVSTRGYGLFVDSTSCVRFDMACGNHAAITLIVPDDALDYYVIAGPELKTVVSRYARLTGRPVLPPKWAFGLWVSGGFQPETQDQVLDRARRLRAEGVPSDVLHVDCYWQRFGRWSEMLFDSEAFPDPEGMIRELKAMGFKVSLWMNPYLSIESERFAEARDEGFLLAAPDGEPCAAKLWGDFHPPVGLIDMTHPGAVEWFQGLLRPLLEMGVDVFKTDFGEGVPAAAVSHGGMTGDKLHNLYPLLYNDAVAAVTAEVTGRTGLVWARSSHAGGQRHGAQWAGDPGCTFQAMASTLRGGLSLAVCGHAYWSHDMGGFHGTPDPELYVRWSQFGFFSPLSRAHGRTARLPWDFGDEGLRIFRDFARLRYRLLPYLFTCAARSAEEGLPMMRPMVLEFPRDPCTYHLDLQYMLGEEILVAPVYNRVGRRHVYFPAGQWIDFWTHARIDGPGARTVKAPLDRMPLFVRADALIPTVEPADSIEEAPFGLVTFDAYLYDRGSFELRDYDGATTVSAWKEGPRLSVTMEGARKTIGFRLPALPGAQPADAVVFNGSGLKYRKGMRLAAGQIPGWTLDKNGTIMALLGGG